MTELDELQAQMDANKEWLREQIAFAIFNSTNPPHMAEVIGRAIVAAN